MIKVIQPEQEFKGEYHCDYCKKQIIPEGEHWDWENCKLLYRNMQEVDLNLRGYAPDNYYHFHTECYEQVFKNLRKKE